MTCSTRSTTVRSWCETESEKNEFSGVSCRKRWPHAGRTGRTRSHAVARSNYSHNNYVVSQMAKTAPPRRRVMFNMRFVRLYGGTDLLRRTVLSSGHHHDKRSNAAIRIRRVSRISREFSRLVYFLLSTAYYVLILLRITNTILCTAGRQHRDTAYCMAVWCLSVSRIAPQGHCHWRAELDPESRQSIHRHMRRLSGDSRATVRSILVVY